MATKQIEINVKTASGYDQLYPKSNAEIITYDNTTSGVSSSDVQGALDEMMPKTGGTFTGVAVAQNNTSYATKQLRNVFMSTEEPTADDGDNGDIWIIYSGE